MLGQFIYTLHPLALSALVLGGTLCVSFLCILCCRYFVRIAYSEDAEFKIETYSDAFGVAFAILLGLLIVTSWTAYDQTDDLLRNEVSYLNDLYNLSDYLPNIEKSGMQQTLRQYVTHVVKNEWPLLPQGEFSKTASTDLFIIFDILYKSRKNNNIEESLLSEMKTILTHLTEKRRARILNAHSSLTPVMWIILLSCNIIAFFILGLAVQGHLIFHTLLQSLYAIGIGLMLFLVIILDRPFYYGFYYGGGISPEHFEILLHDWNEEKSKGGSEIQEAL